MRNIIKDIAIGIVIWIVSFIIGNILTLVYTLMSQGIGLGEIDNTSLALAMGDLDAGQIRVVLFISHMFAFFVPSIAIAWVLYKNKWKEYLEISRFHHIRHYLLGIGFLLVSLPVTLYLNYKGMQLPWPEFMRESDVQAYAMMETLFSSEGTLSIILNVLLVGVMAAVGEELLFRGLIQRNLERWSGPVVAICLSAVIFGGLHLQADGMIARIILGGILGYTYYVSRSLWVPIILHFLYNSIQVLMVELSGEEMNLQADTQMDPGVPWYLALISLIVAAGVAYFWYKNRQHE